MGIDVSGLGAVADLAGKVIDRFFPDKTEQERAQLAAALTVIQGQLDTNKTEAANPSMFVAGWRPGIGWVCAIALLFQYVLRPLLMWVGLVSGHSWPPLPGIDDNLWQLMLGMLGLGGLRTYEKVRGAEGNR
ncbi:MAG: hypothetical protein RJA36_911 [Pseudomonadota bacterium]|jgi:uncharacterized membrane protein